ncbi:MAG: hypothetical protein GX200_03325 [Firmicutes bacterium]|nr:hypothetical protein [Bacillota bacterium]
MDINIGYKKQKATENQFSRQPGLAAVPPARNAEAAVPAKAAAPGLLPAESAVGEYPAKGATGVFAAAPEYAKDGHGGAAAGQEQMPANGGGLGEKTGEGQAEEAVLPDFPLPQAKQEETSKFAADKISERAADNLLLFLLVLILLPNAFRRQTDWGTMTVSGYRDLYRLLERAETNSVVDSICHISLLLGNPREAGQVESALRSFLSREKENQAVKLLAAVAPYLSPNRQSKLREYRKILHVVNLFTVLAQKEALLLQDEEKKQ